MILFLTFKSLNTFEFWEIAQGSMADTGFPVRFEKPGKTGKSRRPGNHETVSFEGEGKSGSWEFPELGKIR